MLAHAKRHRPGLLVKTSLMLGLGETQAEIHATMDDLRAVGVDILTLGQYLRPTQNHLPVERFVTPEEFDRHRQVALDKGFLECVPGRCALELSSHCARAQQRRSGRRRNRRRGP